MGDMNVTSKLVLAFVTLLLGTVLLGVIATSALAVTEKTSVGNEAQVLNGIEGAGTGANSSDEYTITNYPSGWKVDDCPITNFAMQMTNGTALTDTTDYVFNAANGTFVMKNTSTTVTMITPNGDLTGNLTNYDYTYCADDYMVLGWGRTGINLVAGFFAIGILMASLALFYSVAKETGML